MEQDKPTFGQHVLKHGIIIALVLIIVTLIIYVINWRLWANMFFPLIFLALMIAFYLIYLIVVGKQYRNSLDGVLPFKDAFLSTFVIILVAGIIGLIFNIILWKVIDPELASKIKDELINNMTAFMEKNNVPDDQLDEAIAKIEERDMDSIVAQLKNFLYTNVIGGGIISLIVAAVIKKNKEDL